MIYSVFQRKSPFLLFLLVPLLFLFGCPPKPVSPAKRSVYIDYSNGRYTINRNGKPFIIKGASGYSYLQQLVAAGGNTIRTWDTTSLEKVLEDADRYDLAVVAGLYMPVISRPEVFYDDTLQVNAQFIRYKAVIKKYKKHKSLLFWCLGNELVFPFNPRYNSFYRAYNKLVDMIHDQDPDHPVTTTLINVPRRSIVNIQLRTRIDFISVNLFGGLPLFNKEIQAFSWFWKGPFLVTEWGIEGPWPGPGQEKEQTAWGAYIEPTSTKKAEQYLSAYRRFMPVTNPRYLGSFVFYWGQKQETTPTWFSLLAENGAVSETVADMKFLWTSTWPLHKAIKIRYLLLDHKGAHDNIIYKPGNIARATLLFQNTDSSGLTFKWQVLKEDWYKSNFSYNQKNLKPVDSLILKEAGPVALIRIPDKPGPYRIYVYAFDRFGNFATSNIPFFVEEAPR